MFSSSSGCPRASAVAAVYNKAQKLHDELLKNKVIVKVAHGNKLRINPPLIITDTQMSKLLDKFEKSINKI